MSRPTKLNSELTALICENIELGLSYNLSCQAAGVTFETFNDWMKRGAAGDERFIDFGTRVHASEAACAKKCLTRIREAADSGTWSAAAWLIERRFHEYRKDQKIELDAKHTGGVTLTLNVSDCGEDV